MLYQTKHYTVMGIHINCIKNQLNNKTAKGAKYKRLFKTNRLNLDGTFFEIITPFLEFYLELQSKNLKNRGQFLYF